MKTITRKFQLYELDELPTEARNKAISDFIAFEIEIMDEDSPYYELAEDMEKIRTPWFLGEYIYEKELDSIIETIKCNDYLFFKDGELIPRNYYPKNRHPNPGN